MTPAEISWSGTWSAIKAGADERKLRLHAGTNNAEKLERILQLGTVNANASDEHGRTALHIAAAKGRDTITSKTTFINDQPRLFFLIKKELLTQLKRTLN